MLHNHKMSVRSCTSATQLRSLPYVPMQCSARGAQDPPAPVAVSAWGGDARVVDQLLHQGLVALLATALLHDLLRNSILAVHKFLRVLRVRVLQPPARPTPPPQISFIRGSKGLWCQETVQQPRGAGDSWPTDTHGTTCQVANRQLPSMPARRFSSCWKNQLQLPLRTCTGQQPGCRAGFPRSNRPAAPQGSPCSAVRQLALLVHITVPFPTHALVLAGGLSGSVQQHPLLPWNENLLQHHGCRDISKLMCQAGHDNTTPCRGRQCKQDCDGFDCTRSAQCTVMLHTCNCGQAPAKLQILKAHHGASRVTKARCTLATTALQLALADVGCKLVYI